MVFLHKAFYSDYLFVYASDENIFVVLIHPTSYSSDTPEADITYDDVVDNMGDDIMEEME